MSGLEVVIRPFQDRQVSPPSKDLGDVESSPASNCIVDAGTAGSINSFSGSFSQTRSLYMDSKKTEKGRSPSRETEDIKVYQNNDPTTGNFVTFRRIKTIWMQGPNGQWEQWKFVDPDPNPIGP